MPRRSGPMARTCDETFRCVHGAKAMKGVNPAWANLPRRKCDDCGKSYKPKQPLREGTRGFCSDNCRKSYHKHGGAYRKLKAEMVKLVERHMRTIREEIEEMIDGKITSFAINMFRPPEGGFTLRQPMPRVGNSLEFHQALRRAIAHEISDSLAPGTPARSDPARGSNR